MTEEKQVLNSGFSHPKLDEIVAKVQDKFIGLAIHLVTVPADSAIKMLELGRIDQAMTLAVLSGSWGSVLMNSCEEMLDHERNENHRRSMERAIEKAEKVASAFESHYSNGEIVQRDSSSDGASVNDDPGCGDIEKAGSVDSGIDPSEGSPEQEAVGKRE